MILFVGRSIKWAAVGVDSAVVMWSNDLWPESYLRLTWMNLWGLWNSGGSFRKWGSRWWRQTPLSMLFVESVSSDSGEFTLAVMLFTQERVERTTRWVFICRESKRDVFWGWNFLSSSHPIPGRDFLFVVDEGRKSSGFQFFIADDDVFYFFEKVLFFGSKTSPSNIISLLFLLPFAALFVTGCSSLRVLLLSWTFSKSFRWRSCLQHLIPYNICLCRNPNGWNATCSASNTTVLWVAPVWNNEFHQEVFTEWQVRCDGWVSGWPRKLQYSERYTEILVA